MSPILPGATIGLLGGGQLGRMAGMAARSMGYEVHVLDPDPQCPARAIASRVVTAAFSDAVAAADLARGCDVVTLEIEQIARPALDAVREHAPLHPRAEAVFTIQDRLRQRAWLDANGFPLGPYRHAASEDECAAAVLALGPSICKAPTGGYDGRGQVRVQTPDEARAAWNVLGAERCVVEQFLDLAMEISVLVARRADGAEVVYAPAVNHHVDGVLDWSVFPAALPPEIDQQARELGLRLASTMGVVGLLACELFVVRDGRLLVNELAPRPHNTFHHTERAASTGQFEQLVRAICGLPLGDVRATSPGAVANLLGDRWMHGAPDFAAALDVAEVRLHLYGKAVARPGRKMGHLSSLAPTTGEALARVLEARERMTPR